MKSGILSIAALTALSCATACKQQESVSAQKSVDEVQSRTISFIFGPIVRSVSYEDLRVFAETGEARGDIGNAVSLAKLPKADLQKLLTTPIDFQIQTMNDLLNSPLGNSVLLKAGEYISPRHTNDYRVQTIRAAIIASLADDNKATVLEVLKNLPVNVKVEVGKLLEMRSAFSSLFGK